MRPDTLIIVNPASGGGRAIAAEPLVASYLAAQSKSVQFVHSRSSKDIREKALKAAAEGYRYVVALGGDGAFHYVVEGIRGTGAIAGFFPAGNGNDIARDLGIPPDAVSAAAAFCHSVPRSVDLVRVQFRDASTGHFIGAGGMGLDAEAAHLANTRFKNWPGVTRYLSGALWTFFSAPAFELEAELDGTRWAGRAIFAAVANATSYGSGVRIAPDAKMDDGLLEVVLVGDVAWTRLVEAIPIVLTTGDLRFDEVKRFRCRRVALRANRAVKVHGDGELLGKAPAEFSAVAYRAIWVAARMRSRFCDRRNDGELHGAGCGEECGTGARGMGRGSGWVDRRAEDHGIGGEVIHISAVKALGMLGLGRNRIVRVPADSQGRMRADLLPKIAGPTIICMQAGNVNSRAFDPAKEICAVAHAAGQWVHVDAAFGLWAAAAPSRAHLVIGLAEADSWATDAHKWLNVPYDSGIAFVREDRHLKAAMSANAAYLVRGQKRDPNMFTPEISRRARGVEIWAALRSLGRNGLADLI